MSKQRILMIVALCFVLIGTVAAGIPHEPKPDSLVACLGAGGFGVQAADFPSSLDGSACESYQGASCSECVHSLEHQGCDVIDVTTGSAPPEHWGAVFDAVFVLSCE
jgi:hypothetical protein